MCGCVYLYIYTHVHTRIHTHTCRHPHTQVLSDKGCQGRLQRRPLGTLVAPTAWLIPIVPALLHRSSLSPDISAKPISPEIFSVQLFWFLLHCVAIGS